MSVNWTCSAEDEGALLITAEVEGWSAGWSGVEVAGGVVAEEGGVEVAVVAGGTVGAGEVVVGGGGALDWAVCPAHVVITGSCGCSDTRLSAAELHASDSPCENVGL